MMTLNLPASRSAWLLQLGGHLSTPSGAGAVDLPMMHSTSSSGSCRYQHCARCQCGLPTGGGYVRNLPGYSGGFSVADLRRRCVGRAAARQRFWIALEPHRSVALVGVIGGSFPGIGWSYGNRNRLRAARDTLTLCPRLIDIAAELRRLGKMNKSFEFDSRSTREFEPVTFLSTRSS